MLMNIKAFCDVTSYRLVDPTTFCKRVVPTKFPTFYLPVEAA